MSNKMKRLLVLLLILLKEAGPAAAHNCDCSSSWCSCSNRGLTSVPQNLTTTITILYLRGNSITTLSQSDFSRYSSLTWLDLQYNQISVINSGAFYRLSRLTRLNLHTNQLTSLRSEMFAGLSNLQYLYLYRNNIHSIETGTFNVTPQLRTLNLYNNQLTSLRPDMFVGLDNLQYLYLYHNNIHSIEARAFISTPKLRTLQLQNNSIDTFPVEALSNLNTSTVSYYLRLSMTYNQMETLPSAAYDILASFTYAYIHNNPWQCDCLMLPFKQRMNGSYPFENQITCVGPANVTGKSLLLAVEAEDLICEETTTTDSTGTTPGGFSTQSTPPGGSSVHSTPPGGFSAQSTPPGGSPTPPGGSSTPSGEVSLLIGVLCGVAGVVLVSAVSLTIWYRITRKVSPAP
ncbi:PREDICTED: leucine-rich repeat-containing protein 70-like [Branchiostoma belcheri]|uniref:Leucine-rich repeat-containing protein 70-like n=1 Tax=Branchiostoma belcheri TaxID=7741 RepID=A0A6P4ZZ04_BRABE|nr:PREDICTED: leucine-rich repeat-containing protein 70-like [Branchiostoma belcheri]